MTPGQPEACPHVIIAGGGAAARAAAAELMAGGISDFLALDEALQETVFDDATNTWTLHTTAGEAFRCRLVIAAHRPPYVPWIPELPGRNDFRGTSFPAAQWDPEFNPAGKRVAVVGADASAGHYLGRLAESAASVTVFAHAPRRIVDALPTATTRWLGRRVRPAAHSGRSRPALVRSAITGITSTGIRTGDGVDHCADAIIYGTGFAIPDRIPGDTLIGADGVTIHQAWDDGMEPYFGVAVRGFPNYFFLNGPDIGAQAHYVVECVRLMADSAAMRIEVRRSTQQVFNERACLQPPRPQRAAAISKAFDLSSNGGEARAAYDGAATLTIAGVHHPVRARLTGRLDPNDGHYHWQGTVFASASRSLSDEALQQSRTVTLTVGERSAPARIVEKTPWGTHSVAGVGAPPYAPS